MRYILNLFKIRKNEDIVRSDLAIAREIADVLVADVNFRQTMQLTRGNS